MALLTALTALVVAVAAAVFSYLVFRKREFTARQLQRIYDELKARSLEIQKLTRQVEIFKSRLPAEEGNELQTYSRPASRPPEPEKKEQKTDEEDVSSLWQDVIFLARQGLSADKISRDLNITRGEVDLILSLENFDPEKDK